MKPNEQTTALWNEGYSSTILVCFRGNDKMMTITFRSLEEAKKVSKAWCEGAKMGEVAAMLHKMAAKF